MTFAPLSNVPLMNLRPLLKRDLYRKLLLIETLYYGKKAMTSEELTKLLKCTPPVLLNDIRLINEQEKYYQINRRNGLYSLVVADNAGLDMLVASSIDNSISFKILELLFFEECYTLNDLAKHLYCSLSTVQVHLKELSKLLKTWKLKVERKPFRLLGNEVAIRHLYFLLFSEKKAQVSDLKVSTELFDKGEAVIRSMVTENELDPSFAQYRRLSLMFYISLWRVKKNHFMPARLLRSESVTFPEEALTKEFGIVLHHELDLFCTNDLIKETFWLLYSDFFLLGEKQKQRALATNYSLTYHYDTHYELASAFSDLLEVPLTEDQKDQLATVLINQHLFHAETKEFINVLTDKKVDCINLLQNFHGHCLKVIRQLVTDFTDKYQLFQTEDFIANYIYQIIATVPECLSGLKQTEDSVDILVVSNDSMTQERLLSELIKDVVKGNYRLHHFSCQKVPSRNYQEIFCEYDLIVSTSTFDVEDCTTPAIAVELCPSIQSLNKIQHLVDAVSLEKTPIGKS